MKTVYPKDELGGDHCDIDGQSYTVVKVEPFRYYIARKYGGWDNFMKLKFQDKNKIFLKWKHGFTSHETNIALEVTGRYFYNMHKNTNIEEIKNEGVKFYIKQKIWYEDYCFEVKRDIGLTEKKQEVIQEVQEIADKFGGKVIPF